MFSKPLSRHHRGKEINYKEMNAVLVNPPAPAYTSLRVRGLIAAENPAGVPPVPTSQGQGTPCFTRRAAEIERGSFSLGERATGRISISFARNRVRSGDRLCLRGLCVERDFAHV